MTDLPDFDAIRVLCVGDLMLDRFVNGTVSRISPESPVPIIRLSGPAVAISSAGAIAVWTFMTSTASLSGSASSTSSAAA